VEREALRAKTTELIQRLRGSELPHPLFELLDVFSQRLDRIELGHFDSQEEIPTEPARRVSSQSLAATKEPKPIDVKVSEIFEDAKKKPPPGKKDGE